MNNKSPNLQELDALWQAYVKNDPDLLQIERVKLASDKRQAVREYARTHHAPRGKDLALMFIDLVGVAGFLLLAVATFMLAAL